MSDRIFLINNGAVQQSGNPDEIYNHPANPFVADFLGKVDFFKGTASGGRIHLDDWDAWLDDPGTGHSGSVIVAVRPENLRMRAAGESGIPGTLERMYYLGDVTDCRVRVGSALVRVIAEGCCHRELRQGDTVALEVREFIVYPDDGTTAEQLRIMT